MPVSFVPSMPPHQPVQFSQPRECVIEIPESEVAPPRQGLFEAIHSSGFMQAMTDLVAPHMTPGSLGRKLVDQCGVFGVGQAAELRPPHKFGFQANIVKPDIYPHTGNYYLQLFLHNELGFNLLDTFIASSIKDYLPDWYGLGTQLIFNHGIEFPIVHTEQGWKLLGPNDPDGAMLTEELVFRPSEIALKYLAKKYPDVPVQATVAVEVGTHLKWAMNNPGTKWAFASTCAGNALGALAGFATACASGGDPMLLAHGGAMLGQMVTHGLQCWSDSLCPDKVVTWAGMTLGAADTNTKNVMGYPRVWWHGHDGCFQPRNLKQQAEETITDFFKRQRNNAIEMAEMGIDPTTVSTQTRLRSISADYAAQS